MNVSFRCGLFFGGLFAISIGVTELAAAQSFTVSNLRVNAPEGQGWEMVHKTQFGLAFMAPQQFTNSKLVAYANLFDPSVDSRGELLNDVKRNIDQFLNQPHSRILSSKFELTKVRKYPCVRVYAKMEIVPQDQSKNSVPTPAQARLFICRNTAGAPTGFVAGFMYFGNELSESLDAKASAFLTGVRFATE